MLDNGLKMHSKILKKQLKGRNVMLSRATEQIQALLIIQHNPFLLSSRLDFYIKLLSIAV